MFGKVKRYLSKLRIFKRLRAYKAGIQILLDHEKIYQGRIDRFEKKERQFQNIISKNNAFMLKQENEKKKLKEKHDKASKYYGELIKRRNETIHRLQSTAPDDILSGRFADYKLWVAEPLIKKNYKNYIIENDIGIGKVFIDGESAIRGLDNIFKKEDEKEEDINVEEEDK